MKRLWTAAILAAAVLGTRRAGAAVVANGDFSAGNSGFTTGYGYVASGTSTQPGTYGVRTNPQDFNPNLDSFGDHTTGTGNMMVVDGGGSSAQVVWSQTLAVSPNTAYTISAWAASTEKDRPADLQFVANGTALSPDLQLPTTTGSWQNLSAAWNSGSSTSLALSIVDLNTNTALPGNDFALDDISVTPEPSAAVLALCPALAFALRRRRAGRQSGPVS